MKRRLLRLGALLLALSLSPTAAAQAWTCPGRDCGEFPHDPDIMVVPAGGQGVVARWYSQTNHFGGTWRGQQSPLRGVRIFNNLSASLPVFLRTRREFDAFLEFTRREPGVSTCNVVNGIWYDYGCVDAARRSIPCPRRPGVYVVRRLYRCHGAQPECGGGCLGASGHGNGASWVISGLVMR